jgi:DNA-directed RNA polymerase subunit RPC12/RpoP
MGDLKKRGDRSPLGKLLRSPARKSLNSQMRAESDEPLDAYHHPGAWGIAYDTCRACGRRFFWYWLDRADELTWMLRCKHCGDTRHRPKPFLTEDQLRQKGILRRRRDAKGIKRST